MMLNGLNKRPFHQPLFPFVQFKHVSGCCNGHTPVGEVLNDHY